MSPKTKNRRRHRRSVRYIADLIRREPKRDDFSRSFARNPIVAEFQFSYAHTRWALLHDFVLNHAAYSEARAIVYPEL